MPIFYLVLVLLSFVGLVFLICQKIVEIKTGKMGIFGRLSVSADPALRKYVEKMTFFISALNSANFKKIYGVLTSNLFHLFGTGGLFVSKHYGRLTSRLNGRRRLKGRGVVSFFLKDVAESKGHENEDKNHESGIKNHE